MRMYLHPDSDEEVTVAVKSVGSLRWIDVKVGDAEITIFPRDAKHLNEILDALAYPDRSGQDA